MLLVANDLILMVLQESKWSYQLGCQKSILAFYNN